MGDRRLIEIHSMFSKAALLKYRYQFVCILLISILCCPVHTSGNTLRSTADSLLQILEETNDTSKRIETYRMLAALYIFAPEEETYLKHLLDISLKADSMETYYNASYALASLYCNSNQGDSLRMVLDKVKSIAKQQGTQPNVIFDIRNRLCRYYLINQEYEVAMNELVQLIQDVEKAGYDQGLIGTNENLGLIFLLIGRDKESIAPFEKSLSVLQKSKNELRLEIQIASFMSNVYIRLNELDQMKPLLDYYQGRLDQVSHSAYSFTAEEQSYKSSYCMLNSLWLNYYVAKKMIKEADEVQSKAAKYVDEISDPGYTSVYYLAMARYHFLKKDYKQAIEAIDTTLQLDYSLEPLELKIEILKGAGMTEELTEAYTQTIQFVNEQNVNAYKRQINQLRTLHNLIEKEKQEQILQNQRAELTYKQQQLIAFFIFVSILVVILIGVIRYTLNIKALKTKLQKQQDVLRESTEYLRIAKEEAERADHLKTEFVASVSHEIRTPLNAIVGFSALLDEADGEEQDEFINIINTNTDLLLKLVNDVLDLSKLEADNFRLNILDMDVERSCQEVLESIRHRIANNVKLTFTHPP